MMNGGLFIGVSFRANRSSSVLRGMVKIEVKHDINRLDDEGLIYISVVWHFLLFLIIWQSEKCVRKLKLASRVLKSYR